MVLILVFIIVILLMAVAGLAVYARQEAGKHGTGAGQEFAGICKTALQTASQKEARKQKIVAMFEGPEADKKLSNAEVRKALGVSSRTAVRYLEDLEIAGKVEQVGKVGHTVTYRLK
ncbi:MAG: hypothetical protein A3J48_03570 [Candidatus Doudnabacteria bacterium RIFCSPHIGHO2_02_FULL_46_11]|uniref:Helix-turn-helix type 11 domain-containing protein n=1 Tax=Candidatus Doudnabacteria bacterium RIFCSPHIGHO2_02_FULL_46_11 TaxID=1817832 RepID=A0A1F5P488_9BACT|nr:MAG: hypothetical protein A3J48_03570 [Candidatus Doudnabacteria bacterium RIFCSPHIGHO2_02_FULL_46_11]